MIKLLILTIWRSTHFLTEYTFWQGGMSEAQEGRARGPSALSSCRPASPLVGVEQERRELRKDGQKCFKGRVSIPSSPTPLPVN